MDKLWQKIIDHKTKPIYWPVVLLLAIISIFYRFGLFLNSLFNSDPINTKTPLLSIGNLTVGGTGKTPVTIFVARYFVDSGKKVGIVCSGYGRRNKINIAGTGSEITNRTIADTGDELMEMALAVPEAYYSVAKSKTEATLLLEKNYEPDLIILDDGFQHRKLGRRIDILLLDAGMDLRNESIFPLGRLRERFSAAKRADLILLTKYNFAGRSNDFCNLIQNEFKNKPIYKLNFLNDLIASEGEEQPIISLTDRKCYFFAGIGNYTSLLNHLNNSLQNIVHHRQFPDHCLYGETELDFIKNDLEKYQPEYIITTYKDYTKLRTFDFGLPLYYLKLKLRVENNEMGFYEIINSKIEQ